VDNDSAKPKSTESSLSGTEFSLRTLRRERLTRRHILEQIQDDGASAPIVLDREEMVMGRDAGAHIRLASPKASPRHVFFRLRGPDCVMVDNDSDHGVRLNGVKVHSAVLRDGDVIHVADSVFVYHEE
jgi:pSer/pThr/pTyr-binding forkhead associated (FHA) protein